MCTLTYEEAHTAGMAYTKSGAHPEAEQRVGHPAARTLRAGMLLIYTHRQAQHGTRWCCSAQWAHNVQPQSNCQ